LGGEWEFDFLEVVGGEIVDYDGDWVEDEH
jgi:hypothetical protein